MSVKDRKNASLCSWVCDPHFFQNCGHFQYASADIKTKSAHVICIENDHNFERNEDHRTVMDFRFNQKYFLFINV